MLGYLRPKYFFLGFFLGFILCCVSGYVVSTKARFHHFSRFFRAIDPQALYYPTASELLVTARHDVRPEQILVLIGGSSVFKGDGQDPDELWSDELQKLLGNKFKVLNYAADSASFSSYGGVAFRMLRKEHPKIIFVAAAYRFDSEGGMDGTEPYQYLFWDAYYKKLFQPDKKEAELIKHMIKKQIKTTAGAEMHIFCFLDSFFYFKNLWNGVTYRLFSTAWSEHLFQNPLRPRRVYHDEPLAPDYKKLVIKTYNHDEEYFKKYVELIKVIATGLVVDLSKAPLQIREETVHNAREGYDQVFQPADRSKILMVQTAYNTFIIAATAPPVQKAYWFANDQSALLLKALGYHALNVGKDFIRSDFTDFGHLTGSGGKKLAVQVAKKVKYIAKLNGY